MDRAPETRRQSTARSGPRASSRVKKGDQRLSSHPLESCRGNSSVTAATQTSARSGGLATGRSGACRGEGAPDTARTEARTSRSILTARSSEGSTDGPRYTSYVRGPRRGFTGGRDAGTPSPCMMWVKRYPVKTLNNGGRHYVARPNGEVVVTLWYATLLWRYLLNECSEPHNMSTTSPFGTPNGVLHCSMSSPGIFYAHTV